MIDSQGDKAIPLAQALFVTAHQRNFLWLNEKGSAGAIGIFRSWHDRS
jgi:hypothetical protein